MIKRLREWVGESPARLARDAARYWAASRDDDSLQAFSHWRGRGRWKDDDTWLAIGREHRRRYEELLRLARPDGPFATMAEWGPGGGSNALAFRDLFPRFHGIDIAAANLDECARQLSAAGYEGFHPIHFDAGDPESVHSRIHSPLDFFLSTAVFQHFPGKEYGAAVTRIACELLRPGGIALIQTRYDDAGGKYRTRRANYAAHARTFTSYSIDEYWQIAARAGFRPLAVSLVPETNYAYYSLLRPSR